MPILFRLLIQGLAFSALAGCSLGGSEAAMFLLDPPTQEDTLPNRLGRVELREIALPRYAAGQEVVRQGPDGALRGDPAAIWADAPARGLTQALAAQISGVSGATALAQPWPLSAPPDRTLEVRIDRIFAGSDGLFHLSGQYFVAPRDEGRDIVRRFDIAEPLAAAGPASEGAPAPAAVAAAQARAVQALARQIAQLR
jgi:uncharacterized lipoprotein YmbA